MWSAYWTRRALAERDSLMAHYADLVETTARRVMRRLPVRHTAGVEDGDLIAAGQIGLALAIERFDVGRHRRGFEGYACRYIAGQMRTYLAAMDWAHRDRGASRRRGDRVASVIRPADQRDAAAPPLVETAEAAAGPGPGRRETLERLARELGDEQLQMIELHWFGGLEIAQVAMRMKLSLADALELQRETVARLRQSFGYAELVEILSAA